MRESQIAAMLNQRGVMTDLERTWTHSVVHGILTNEKYIGNNIYNRRSFKLKKHRVVNTPDMWVRADGVFEAIIEPRYFYEAQGIIRERNRRFSDEEMLTKLKALHERQGWLSGILIDEEEDMPSSGAYASRFGGLFQAYKLIGYNPGYDQRFIEDNRHLRKMYPEVVEGVISKIQELGGPRTPRGHKRFLDRQRRDKGFFGYLPVLPDGRWQQSLENSVRCQPDARHHDCSAHGCHQSPGF